MPAIDSRPSLRRPRRPALLAALCAGLGLGLAAPAQAQSLLELYEAARGYDATYLGARAQAESAEYRAAQARALMRPSIGVAASATRSETDPPTGGGSYSNTNGQLGLSARQPLFNRGNSVSIEQAERSREVAQAQFRAVEQELIVRVAQAYFAVLSAQDALETVRTSKAAISEQLAAAKRNFEVGTATITDTREAQARFDLATAQEIAAENELRVQRIALDQLVGIADVKPHPLTASVTLPALAPEDLAQWVRDAETGHPSVRQAALSLDIAQLEIDKARAGHLPTVDLVGNVARNRNSYSGGALPPTLVNGSSSAGSVGVQLNLPLFAGFSVQNRVRETVALEEAARNNLDAARRGVAQGTRQAFFGVQSGQAQVKALEAALASSQLALEATQLGYKVGVRVNLDVLNAQSQLFSTRRDLAQARYNVVLGNLRLRQAAGVLGPEDVAKVNTLLAP